MKASKSCLSFGLSLRKAQAIRPALTKAVGLTPLLAGLALPAALGDPLFPPADRDPFEVALRLTDGTPRPRTAETARAVTSRQPVS
jgi:hypothetical protein